MDEEISNRIEQSVESKMESMKGSLLKDIGNLFEKISESSNSSQLSKLCSLVASEPKFKRKSNEEQYKYNAKVFVKLNEAEGSLEAEKIDDAHSRIVETKEMISHRQKLIQLADSCELGWRVVQEYESNPLADDSEDEKRMYKAESRANRKLKAERTRKSRGGRTGPYGRSSNSKSPTATLGSGSAGATQGLKPGLCFQCGKPGHWRKDCRNSSSNNKLSSLFLFSDVSQEVKKPNDWHVKSYSTAKNQNVHLHSDLQMGDICYVDNGESIIRTVGNPSVSPVGRLRSHISKWRSVVSESYILDVVEHGYKLPFKTFPPGAVLNNNISARDNPSFVQEEIDNLLNKGVVSVVKDTPVVVNPLTVAYSKSGKARLVLDCRHINQYLHLFKVKFEDIHIAQELFDLNSFIFTYDLKGAYHHIDIFSPHRTFLGFSWPVQGHKTYFVYNSLPFGIKTAGHIFTKTLRVVVSYLRSLGHKVIMFLDDGIGGNTEFELAVKSSEFVKSTLCQFGFLLADEKCQCMHIKRACWLGHVLDYNVGKLFISEDRIERLEHAIDSVLYQMRSDKCKIVNVKLLASLVGQIISLQFVFGNKVRLKTREMYNCIITRASWNAPVLVTKAAEQEMLFRKHNARCLNVVGRPLKHSITCDFTLFCDASAVGYGGTLQLQGKGVADCILSSEVSVSGEQVIPPEVGLSLGDKAKSDVNMLPYLPDYMEEPVLLPEVSLGQVHGKPILSVPPEVGSLGNNLKKLGILGTLEKSSVLNVADKHVVGSWLQHEKYKSSTWREAEAVSRIIKTHVKCLENKAVKVYSDNKNVKSVLLYGSRNTDLQKVAIDLHNFCDKHEIQINPDWIPRENNMFADYLSRCQDSDDWSISDSVFTYLDILWGKHTFDRFSSHYNNHCKRFNSSFWVPGTEGVNAFNFSWKGENNWLVPPPRLVINCLDKVVKEKAESTLVIPKWKSAAFWPCLLDDKGSFRRLKFFQEKV